MDIIHEFESLVKAALLPVSSSPGVGGGSVIVMSVLNNATLTG